jgi:hypothetical protein
MLSEAELAAFVQSFYASELALEAELHSVAITNRDAQRFSDVKLRPVIQCGGYRGDWTIS